MMMKNEHRYKKYWSCDEKVYGGGGDDEIMWKKYWDCEVWVAQCQRG